MSSENKDILKFCFEKGLLVDNEVLDLFNDVQDVDSIKFIIDRIKTYTGKNVITTNTLRENKEKLNRLVIELPEEKQKKLEKLKVKLGLSIEISGEVGGDSSTKRDDNNENPYKSKLNQPEEGRVHLYPETDFPNKKLEVKDFVSYFKNRYSEMKNILQEHSELTNLVSINKISGNKQGISLIGIVSDKKITKNNNILLQVEDLTGSIRVLINQNKPELYKKAEDISLDSVLGFKGSGNKEILFVNDLVYPEAMLPEKKKSPVEEYAIFIGDMHFGSKLFLKKSWENFINYLSNSNPDAKDPNSEVKKIKYLFIAGDIVTGVGNYPDQENDLEINDLEGQFMELSKYLDRIRKDIKIIISPGNHDGVRIMEPQPVFDEKFAWPLYQLKNVILTENPSYVNIGSTDDFEGIDVLTYHGFSFSYYANNISSLIQQDAMNSPTEIMKYLLKNRHLAPAHTSTQYYPLEKDPLIIKKSPDVFVAAHTHKCSIDYYNNILNVSVSCWEGMTSYQEKMGNQPDHCKVPLLNLKKGNVKILDFEDTKESEDKRLMR